MPMSQASRVTPRGYCFLLVHPTDAMPVAVATSCLKEFSNCVLYFGTHKQDTRIAWVTQSLRVLASCSFTFLGLGQEGIACGLWWSVWCLLPGDMVPSPGFDCFRGAPSMHSPNSATPVCGVQINAAVGCLGRMPLPRQAFKPLRRTQPSSPLSSSGDLPEQAAPAGADFSCF